MSTNIDKIRAHRLDINLEAKLKEEQIIAIAQKASIWDLQKVLRSAGVSQSDIQSFFSSQHAKFMAELIKPDSWYASIPLEPLEIYNQVYSAPISKPELQLNDVDIKMFVKSMNRIVKTTESVEEKEQTDASEAKNRYYSEATGAMQYKAATGGKKTKASKAVDAVNDDAATPEGTIPVSDTPELDLVLDEQLDSLDSLLEDLSYRVVDQQIASDASNKSDEIKRELARLMALARSGSIDVSYVVVALAKFTCAKNGAIFANLGKKLFSYNERINQINSTLYGKEFDLANSQIVANKQRDLNFQMQQLQMSMQDVTKNITTIMEFANNVLNLSDRTKRDLISKVRTGY